MLINCKYKVPIDGYQYTRTILTTVIDLTQDLEEIWNRMDKTCRYKIRRAEREQIQIKFNQDHQEFYDISLQFQKEKGFGSLFSLRHPDLDTIREKGTLITMYYQNELLGGHVYLEDQDNILMWISASQRLHVDKEKAALISRANRLLHWEAIKYARQKGIKEYDLNGIWFPKDAVSDPEKQNLNSFKLSFGGEVVERYEYLKYHSKLFRFGRYIYHKLHPLKQGSLL